MPKKKNVLSPKDQSERFEREVERLIAAGELSPTEANHALDSLVRSAARQRPPSTDD